MVRIPDILQGLTGKLSQKLKEDSDEDLFGLGKKGVSRVVIVGDLKRRET